MIVAGVLKAEIVKEIQDRFKVDVNFRNETSQEVQTGKVSLLNGYGLTVFDIGDPKSMSLIMTVTDNNGAITQSLRKTIPLAVSNSPQPQRYSSQQSHAFAQGEFNRDLSPPFSQDKFFAKAYTPETTKNACFVENPAEAKTLETTPTRFVHQRASSNGVVGGNQNSKYEYSPSFAPSNARAIINQQTEEYLRISRNNTERRLREIMREVQQSSKKSRTTAEKSSFSGIKKEANEMSLEASSKRADLKKNIASAQANDSLERKVVQEESTTRTVTQVSRKVFHIPSQNSSAFPLVKVPQETEGFKVRLAGTFARADQIFSSCTPAEKEESTQLESENHYAHFEEIAKEKEKESMVNALKEPRDHPNQQEQLNSQKTIFAAGESKAWTNPHDSLVFNHPENIPVPQNLQRSEGFPISNAQEEKSENSEDFEKLADSQSHHSSPDSQPVMVDERLEETSGDLQASTNHQIDCPENLSSFEPKFEDYCTLF